MNAIGATTWVIPEGYIPGRSSGPEPAMTSHGTMCILNAGERAASIEVMIYFADRDPVGPYRLNVEAQRTKHARFNDLDDPAPIPRDTDFASVITSDEPVVVQHTRLDSRQPAHALMTTMAFPADQPLRT